MNAAQIATAIAIGLALAALILLGFGLARMSKLSDQEDQEPYGDASSYNHPQVK